MVERISTFSTHQTAVNDLMKVQSDMANLQRQITSGRKADTFTEMGSDITAAMDLESSLKSTDKFIKINKNAITRLETMDTVVRRIQKITTDFSSSLALENSSSGSSLNITELATTALNQIADALNTSHAGRSLFSGSKTDKDAVNVATLMSTSNLINDIPTANYYQGDDRIFSVKAGENIDVTYGIKANDIAFQNIISALHEAIESEKLTGGKNNLARADELLQVARSELARVNSQIGTDMNTLEKTNAQHTIVKTQLNDVLSDLVGTDIVEASINVALNEAVLTATMQTFGRISRLSLTDFLR